MICLEGYISALYLEYLLLFAALQSLGLLLLYSMITLALHNTTILIITRLYLSTIH